jgi:heterodisulfide reductase subunit D
VKEKKDSFIKGKGITKLTTVANQEKLEDHQNLDYYKEIYYQCGKCGTCRTAYQEDAWSRVCPSGEFGKFEAYYLGGKNLLTWALTTGKLNWTENLTKIFYQCSVCLACMQQCQVPEIHNFADNWLMALRQEAVNQGLGPMPEHKRYTEHVSKEFNPYMEKHENRLDWMPSHLEQTENAKLAYFVGCTSSYREKNIAKATAEILNQLGIKFKILKEEHCCGSPVYMTGQLEKAIEIAKENVKIFSEAGIERIITSCAGCYRMLKDTYPINFNLDHKIEVLHLPEFLLEMVKSGDLTFEKELPMKITYHDPCHLGRHMGVYEPPRDLLSKIPGIEVIEMVRNKYNAWCCGSGGGVRSAFKGLSEFAAGERIKEAEGTHAMAIVSACPFCVNQFKSVKNTSLQVFDISELVRKVI